MSKKISKSRYSMRWARRVAEVNKIVVSGNKKRDLYHAIRGLYTTDSNSLDALWVEFGRGKSAGLGGLVTDASVAAKKKRDGYLKFSAFYKSKAWRKLRYQVLLLRGPVCCLCGATRKDGVVLHVDHIKPRYQYPELELDIDNLQVLCEDCNMGKGGSDDTNWLV